MSVNVAQEQEKSNSSNTSKLTKDHEQEIPVEVALAMLYTAAKTLQDKSLLTILSGQSRAIIYIRIPNCSMDDIRGFVLGSVGIQESELANT